jgi:hypothetical protein
MPSCESSARPNLSTHSELAVLFGLELGAWSSELDKMSLEVWELSRRDMALVLGYTL